MLTQTDPYDMTETEQAELASAALSFALHRHPGLLNSTVNLFIARKLARYAMDRNRTIGTNAGADGFTTRSTERAGEILTSAPASSDHRTEFLENMDRNAKGEC